MSALEWNSDWYASTDSSRYDTASYTYLEVGTSTAAATAATSPEVTATVTSPTASLNQLLPSEASTSNQAATATGAAAPTDAGIKHSLNVGARILGPVVGGTIGTLFLCIIILVVLTLSRRRRRSNTRTTRLWSCRAKTLTPGSEDTHVEIIEKPIPLQHTSQGVISFDIATMNEHGHSSAGSRLTMGSETTAEFYVNSLNIPSPFASNFRSSTVTARIPDREDPEPDAVSSRNDG